MKHLVKLLLLLVAVGVAKSQDCSYSYRFTNRAGEPTNGKTVFSGASATPGILNSGSGCVGWQVLYSAEGFSALSLTLQTSTKEATGAGGTWSTFSGTDVLGSLPLTSTARGNYIGYTYYPYIRINLTTVTGTGSVDVKLVGWKSHAYLAGAGAGGAPSGGAGGALSGTYPNPSLATLGQNLLFVDATYDIGASGATRPRDLFMSRNLVAGGTGVFAGVLTGLNVKRGAGSPESAVTGVVGDIYQRTDGGSATSVYVKESGSGNTGWVGVGAGGGGGAPTDAQYLTLALNGSLSAERVLTAGTCLTPFVDTGANGTLTINLDNTCAVLIAGSQTISGVKTFSAGPIITEGTPSITLNKLTIDSTSKLLCTGNGSTADCYAEDPTTTRGDMPLRGASSLGALAVGAAGTFVYSDGTDKINRQPLYTDVTGATGTIASGAKALATGAITTETCTSAQTDTATGTATTDTIIATFNADPVAVTGYVPLVAGGLTIYAYPTSNTVNFKVCNFTSGSITPGAITLNWRVVR